MTMTKNELELLHSYIYSSVHYLEYGSGESTIYASKVPSIKTIDSVESSEGFINEHLKTNDAIVSALSTGKLKFYIINIGETIAWGEPKDDSQKHLWPNYSLSVFSQKSKHDLVLVDGRFRVACVLNYITNTPDNCILLIHDFWNRPEYHIVLKYLDVKKQVDTLGVFQKKSDIDRKEVQSLIRIYQYLPMDVKI